MPIPEGWASATIPWSVLGCPCGECDGIPPHLVPVLRETARWAEEISAAVGGWRLLILSAYRCPKWQHRCAEPHDEGHGEGTALDIVVRQLSPATVQKNLIARYPDLVSGLGSYRGYTCVVRGRDPPERWGR